MMIRRVVNSLQPPELQVVRRSSIIYEDSRHQVLKMDFARPQIFSNRPVSCVQRVFALRGLLVSNKWEPLLPFSFSLRSPLLVPHYHQRR